MLDSGASAACVAALKTEALSTLLHIGTNEISLTNINLDFFPKKRPMGGGMQVLLKASASLCLIS